MKALIIIIIIIIIAYFGWVFFKNDAEAPATGTDTEMMEEGAMMEDEA